MANYVRLGTTPYYIGAAGDTKPASCPTGARCYEHDTNKWYITYDAGSHWPEMQDLNALVLGVGNAIVGQVGIDQTTAGTTNGVQINAALPTGTNAIGKIGHDITGIGDGRETVDTVGAAQAIVTSSTPAKYVQITALVANTDVICVGGSTVVEDDATRRGRPLYAGESTPWIPCDNLADIYIDAAVQHEGVSFIYLTQE